jgi:hypothetical protein
MKITQYSLGNAHPFGDTCRLSQSRSHRTICMHVNTFTRVRKALQGTVEKVTWSSALEAMRAPHKLPASICLIPSIYYSTKRSLVGAAVPVHAWRGQHAAQLLFWPRRRLSAQFKGKSMMHTAAMPKLLLRLTTLMWRLFVPQLLSRAIGQT